MKLLVPWKRRASALQVMLLLSSVSILFLLGTVFFAGRNVITLKDLSVDASDLLAEWNALGLTAQDLLLSRAGPAAGSDSLKAFGKAWIAKARGFDASLEDLRSKRRLSLLRPDWHAKLDAASALWAITYQKLVAAEGDLETIIESGLAAKVFPGFIYNYYSKRDLSSFGFDEIVLLMNFTNKIAILDISSNEFNREVEEIAAGIRSESEDAIRRIVVLSVCLFLLFVLTIAIAFRIQREYASLRAQKGLLEEESRTKAIRELLLGPAGAGRAGEAPPVDVAALPVALDSPLVVLLFRVNRFSDFCAKHNRSERDGVMASAIRLICREAGVRSMASAGADFDNHLVVIMNPSPGEAVRGLVELFAADIRETMPRNLGLRFSTTACRVPEGAPGLGSAYLKAVQASNYRFTRGPDALIWADEASAHEPDSYVYPVEKERLLCAALKSGKLEEARQEYKSISLEASAYPYIVAQSVVLRLALAVGTTIELMERSHGSKILTEVVSLISRINALETIEEVDFAFYDVFRSVAERLDETRLDRHLALVGGVDRIIDREYRNHNLSLDMIADELKLSASYTGRLYRKQTSKSISEAINEKRLKIAAALLLEKHISIQKITDEVGITNSAYFFTLFKRAYGLTPNEYRRQKLSAG
jgi:AraC-like DNA-binding protein